MSATPEPIAVIGSGCRFPGDASNPSKLWNLLSKPRDVLRKIDRFGAEGYYHKDGHHHGASNVLESYLLEEDPRHFDAQFFNIQSGEADSIDPQQRILLETIYEGLETAGLTIEGLQGSPTAVYVGIMCDDYAEIVYNDIEQIPTYAATGIARSILSNRISYFFDWRGPSMTIDTACSSSLIAVHQGVQALRSGESKVAVAAGANLIFGPKMYISESNLNMLSPTGRSRMWDAGADGYARGEGIAAVIMKTLSQAIADGDNIECIIRETGINQDGRTTGITMPSSDAQAALIRQTYARAGLDLTKRADRPQYFEAHGTGTKAGDPKEAGAIYRAFFPEGAESADQEILHVGSIKTIIGHTEGTAGVAGLIKASLAIQNKTIPPNMHFHTLNPDIEQYWDHLRIPTKAQQWPELAPGSVPRASVNSFGFGGANAHAIIEAYTPEPKQIKAAEEEFSQITTPFTFSATSEKSLNNLLTSYHDYLLNNPEVNLRDLVWTLNNRRSAFGNRVSFAAKDVDSLCSKIEAKLEAKKEGTAIGTKPINKGRKILGVFTGQGAQWAAMGKELINSSFAVDEIFNELERSLAELPEKDRPTWSLKDEIRKSAAESRIGEGALSQPLCTAIQVALVDCLRTAGITFNTVVGHSSGEIAAAYAAGFVSARDAIRIAYYRGLFAKLARGPNDEHGAMMAAGTSMEDAQELCDLEDFEGKLKVAACNSSASVTLSGDEEIVQQAQAILEDESKFARMLKVDTAYHSHHMIPCSGPYVAALKACGIKVNEPNPDCHWFSSVYGNKEMKVSDELKDTYWMDNMLKPVLFAQALEFAVKNGGNPNIAIEVGPHPALKGPASMTIEDAAGSPVPYTGVLARGQNDVVAFADGLGFVWNYFGKSVVNFEAYDALFCKDAQHVVPKDLPSYAWDHERTYWSESRVSKTTRTRQERTHELLGQRSANDAEGEYHWRNYIKPGEINWLQGHKIQGQMLFPAAGFAAMALEASKVLAPSNEVSLVELRDFSIHRALSMMDEQAGVEILFGLTNVKKVNTAGERAIFCDFECHACLNKDSGVLTSMSNGSLKLTLGEPDRRTLPERTPSDIKLVDVDVDVFYTELANVGYGYTDMFYGIKTLERATDRAGGVISIIENEETDPTFTIHPATLDVAFQAVFAALGAPGDGGLYTMHIPTMIKKITVNPIACPPGGGPGVDLPFDASIETPLKLGLRGDVDIYDETGHNAIVRVEGLKCSPLTQPTPENDRHIFSETQWDVAAPNVELYYKPWVLSDVEKAGNELCERSCLFYLRQAHETITEEERARCDWHQLRILEWAKVVVEFTATGKHGTCKKEWLSDTYDFIRREIDAMIHIYDDFKRLVIVGENLIPFLRGETSILEKFRENDLLSGFYKSSFAMHEYNVYCGKVAGQLAHRYKHMNILEIGAGTGSVTETTLESIGENYNSYTYTDISAGFFEDAQEHFKEHSGKMRFKTLDIEKDVASQDFEENSYDLIVASNVLHATTSLDNTIKNARSLLKPGGYLLMLEITWTCPLRIGFIFAGIPGWWVGGDDDRRFGPMTTTKVWDQVFRRNGFSGIDTCTPDSGVPLVPFSVFATQAVDTQISYIREPLSLPATKPVIDNLLILGGKDLPVTRLIEAITPRLQPLAKQFTVVECIEDIDFNTIGEKPTVLSLTELEEPFFKPFTPEKLAAAGKLFDMSKAVVWTVQGARGDNPYASMMVAVGRCLASEMPQLRMQFLDLDVNEKPDATYIAETVLRVAIADSWKKEYAPLWTIEREISYSKGIAEISRYVPEKEANDRYNSTRRPVTKSVLPLETAVALVKAGTSLDLKERVMPQIEDDTTTIRVSRSVATAIKVKSVGFVHLVIGQDTKTQKKVLALSENHQSVISVPKTAVIPCEVSEDQESRLLAAIANDFVASAILGKSPKGASIAVHEPTPLLAAALARRAAEQKVNVSFTTSKGESSIANCTYIHPATTDRVIRSMIPTNVSVFVNLSGNTDVSAIHARIEEQMPVQSKRKELSSFLSAESFIRPDYATEKAAAALQAAYTATVELASAVEPVGEIAVKDIPGRSAKVDELSIIHWEPSQAVNVKVPFAEAECTFRSDKTYFLIGLTGELGLSLCKWMVDRGARHIALTSRNPNIDEGWMRMIEKRGANVQVFSMDVTSKEAILATHQKIVETMPPICGVANGAMVLIDQLFANMDFENMSRVLKPKVDGSIFLDEIFNEKYPLDWFIYFSSLACITGNSGQTPYAASNAFMVALTHNRRKRGLPAAAMNLAGIKGLGYIARTDHKLLDRLDVMGYATVSERDFHQFFAEAVFAAPADSGKNAEISTGLASYDPDTNEHAPLWVHQAKFSHYRLIKQAGGGNSGKNNDSVPVKTQLLEQTNLDDVYKILLESLLATLHTKLSLAADDSISPDTAIVELGVDSLVAVDMRSWFTDELDLDMPVLKILGGASVSDLIEDAVSRLPQELIPNVKLEAAEGAETEEKEKEAEEVEETKEAESPESDGESDFATPETASDVDVEDPTSNTTTPAEPEAEEVPATSIEVAAAPVKSNKLTFTKTAKMSYGASRFWFLRQYLSDPTTFNIVTRIRMNGYINLDELGRAVKVLSNRHDAFRTVFFAAEGTNEPTVGVLPYSTLSLEKKAITSEEEAIAETQALASYNFDLEHGESTRIRVLTMGQNLNFLLIACHHIAMDGFSFNVMIEDLNKLYAHEPLAPVKTQFTDFAIKQRKEVESGKMAKELKFWKSEFPNFPEPLPLFPVAQVSSRRVVEKYDFTEAGGPLDGKTCAQIKDQCRRFKVTTFHFCLAVLKIWLFRFLEIDDVVIGMADANRTDGNIADTIGFLLNLLPLRFKNNPKQKFTDALMEARTKTYSALANSKLPFDVLLEELDIPRSSTYSPLYQVFLDYRQLSVRSPPMMNCNAEGETVLGKTAYDLVFDIMEIAGEDISVKIRSQAYLYNQGATEILLNSYVRLLKMFAQAPDTSPQRVQLFDQIDTKSAIEVGRGKYLLDSSFYYGSNTKTGPSMESDWPETISHRIDEMAQQYGTDVAVKDGVGNALTYKQLSERADAISASLTAAGVKDGSHVAVFQEPTADWISSMVAIWRSGGVYVPLDLRHPMPRLAAIVKDCAPVAILFHKETASNVADLEAKSAKIIDVSSLSASAKATPNHAQAKSPAVILYTSGSTGTPKGIMLRHSAIRNEIEGYTKTWKIGRETVLQQSAYSFDFSLDQMLSGLANGGSLIVVPKSKRGDAVEQAKLIATEKVTYTKATPSEYAAWLRYGSEHLSQAAEWSFAFGGGEPFTTALKQEFRTLAKPGLRLYNSYGPGEITIACTKIEIPYMDASADDVAPPAGLPLPNYSLYIVDKNLDPVPIGVSGEVLIGGAGAAFGYLNNDKLTKAKFVADKNASAEYVNRGWTIAYRSGDMGRLNPDGSLVFEGRIEGDSQIKLNGIRIELEDIESSIVKAAEGAINKAIVSVRGEPQFLVAFVEFKSTVSATEQAQILSGLKSKLNLPQYMLPAMMVPVDQMPLNNHSKTDRIAVKALPLPAAAQTSSSDEPLTETERTLKDVWMNVVSKDIAGMVGIEKSTDFFHVGGNSLLLVKLQSLIREKFSVTLPLIDLFENCSLSSMATKIESASSVVEINWDEETALPADIISRAASASPKTKRANSGLTVALTGPTGYVGRHLLQELVADDRVSNIHVLAVRRNGPTSRQLSVKSSKITMHEGNLTAPLLGMSAAEFDKLSNELDVIIHSGASRSFWDYYQLLRGSNVSSTKEIVRLAALNKVPIHFISSNGVLGLDPSAGNGDERSVSAFAPATDGSNGYVASKWASEKFLENAATQLNIPVTVHRVTPQDVMQAPTPEMLQEFSDLAIKMKMLPSQAGWNGTFDLIPTKDLAAGIVGSALSDNEGLVFVHHRSSVKMDMKDVMEKLKTHEGYETFDRMPAHKWMGKAKAIGVSWHFASQDGFIGAESGEGALKLKR